MTDSEPEALSAEHDSPFDAIDVNGRSCGFCVGVLNVIANDPSPGAQRAAERARSELKKLGLTEVAAREIVAESRPAFEALKASWKGAELPTPTADELADVTSAMEAFGFGPEAV